MAILKFAVSGMFRCEEVQYLDSFTDINFFQYHLSAKNALFIM